MTPVKSNAELLQEIMDRYGITEPPPTPYPLEDMYQLERRAYHVKRELLSYIGLIVTDGERMLRVQDMCADVRILRAVISDIERELCDRTPTQDIPGRKR